MKNIQIIKKLTIIIIVISIVAAITGIFSNNKIDKKEVTSVFGENIELHQRGLYARDSESMATQAIAQDIVTVIVAIPLLIVSLILANKKSLKGLLLLTGTVGYFLYTYTSYSFLMSYNSFYLLYLVLMAASFYDFILCMITLKESNIDNKLKEHFPVKAISIFVATCGVIIFLMWIGRIVPSITCKEAPYGLEQYTTLGIQSLDLGFVVPACFVSVYLLRKKNIWGYLLTSVLIVKMVTMCAAVSAMGITMYVKGISDKLSDICVFPFFTIFSAYFLYKIIGSLKE